MAKKATTKKTETPMQSEKGQSTKKPSVDKFLIDHFLKRFLKRTIYAINTVYGKPPEEIKVNSVQTLIEYYNAARNASPKKEHTNNTLCSLLAVLPGPGEDEYSKPLCVYFSELATDEELISCVKNTEYNQFEKQKLQGLGIVKYLEL